MTDRIDDRIQAAINLGEVEESEQVEDLLSEGYARALRLDADRIDLERQITTLAARADDAAAANALRRTWLRHRTVVADLRELRGLLRRLKSLQQV